MFTDWHTEDGSSIFQRARKFKPELQTRRKDVPSEVHWFRPKLLNMEASSSKTVIMFYQNPEMKGAGPSESTAKFYHKPPKLQQISTINLRNYGKFLPETSETTANFYHKPPKIRQISTTNLQKYGKFLQEISETTANFYHKPPKTRQVSTTNLRKYGKFLPETSETLENFCHWNSLY